MLAFTHVLDMSHRQSAALAAYITSQRQPANEEPSSGSVPFEAVIPADMWNQELVASYLKESQNMQFCRMVSGSLLAVASHALDYPDGLYCNEQAIQNSSMYSMRMLETILSLISQVALSISVTDEIGGSIANVSHVSILMTSSSLFTSSTLFSIYSLNTCYQGLATFAASLDRCIDQDLDRLADNGKDRTYVIFSRILEFLYLACKALALSEASADIQVT